MSGVDDCANGGHSDEGVEIVGDGQIMAAGRGAPDWTSGRRDLSNPADHKRLAVEIVPGAAMIEYSSVQSVRMQGPVAE